MTRTQCHHLSLITQVIDLIYYTTLAHNSMKDTKFKIVSMQAVRAIELLLYNFNFTDWFICYSRHVTRYKLPSQKILPPPTVSSTSTKWCRMLNLMLCVSMSITLPSELQHLSNHTRYLQCLHVSCYQKYYLLHKMLVRQQNFSYLPSETQQLETKVVYPGMCTSLTLFQKSNFHFRQLSSKFEISIKSSNMLTHCACDKNTFSTRNQSLIFLIFLSC